MDMLKHILIYAAKNYSLQAPTDTFPVKKPQNYTKVGHMLYTERWLERKTPNAPSEKRTLFAIALRPTCRAVTVSSVCRKFYGVLRMSQIWAFSVSHRCYYLWNSGARQSLLYRTAFGGESVVWRSTISPVPHRAHLYWQFKFHIRAEAANSTSFKRRGGNPSRLKTRIWDSWQRTKSKQVDFRLSVRSTEGI
jgi:hypothetical protein